MEIRGNARLRAPGSFQPAEYSEHERVTEPFQDRRDPLRRRFVARRVRGIAAADGHVGMLHL